MYVYIDIYFISWIFEKECDKSKFSWLALLFKHFFIKIQPNMSEQEKNQQRIYDLLNDEMVLDTSLLNTQQYKVHIKGKVEQSRERSCALPYTSV